MYEVPGRQKPARNVKAVVGWSGAGAVDRVSVAIAAIKSEAQFNLEDWVRVVEEERAAHDVLSEDDAADFDAAVEMARRALAVIAGL